MGKERNGKRRPGKGYQDMDGMRIEAGIGMKNEKCWESEEGEKGKGNLDGARE